MSRIRTPLVAASIVDRISSYGPQAVFVKDGEVCYFRVSTANARKAMKSRSAVFVGVYDDDADIRAMIEDIDVALRDSRFGA